MSGATKTVVEMMLGWVTRARRNKVGTAAVTNWNNMVSDWRDCGLNIIEPSPVLAASMMATSIQEVSDLRWPWPAFVVNLGASILPPVVGMDLTHREDRALSTGSANCALFVSELSSFLLWIPPDEKPGDFIPPLVRFAVGGTPTSMLSNSEHAGYCGVGYRRLGPILVRLAVGCALELGSCAMGDRKRRPRSMAERLAARNVVAAPYVLTRPVKVDCRPYVAEFLAGRRNRLSVRYMVRGHWRLQPCGPGRTERRYVHIEPHWKGPDCAPVAVRPHVMDHHEHAGATT